MESDIKFAECKQHLPGNVTCPIYPVYDVCWRNPVLPGQFNGGLSYFRPVCHNHLAPAIDAAIDDAGKLGRVEVRMFGSERKPVLVDKVVP